MNRILIRTGVGEAFNAAGKARRDADALAVRRGYQPFLFTGDRTAEGSLAGALRLAMDGLRNWRRLLRSADAGSLILIQYPHFPLKTAPLMRRMMLRGRKQKGLKFVALVHDLDSARGLNGAAAVYSDRQVLPLFDGVICHNEKMKELLIHQGIPEDRLIPLGLFDYLTEAQGHPAGDGIAIAGNLDPEKSGYISRLAAACGTELHLYGKGTEHAPAEKNAKYEGCFSPEELPGRLRGAFGLVWDGPDLETCSGRQGEYLRINNPHKLSLYLASGLPVILWSQAALADWVRKEGVGLTVDGLDSLDRLLASVPEEEYHLWRQNAERAGKRVRKGSFLWTALETAERKLQGEI